MNDKLGFTVREAADSLGISVWKLKEEMYQGRIRYIKDRHAGGDTTVGSGRAATAAVGGTGG